jgi:hypothetical protein
MMRRIDHRSRSGRVATVFRRKGEERRGEERKGEEKRHEPHHTRRIHTTECSADDP